MDCRAEQETSERECKICRGAETVEDPFKRPCRCKGSMGYVHTSCLNECLKIAGSCGICGHKFKYVKIFQENMPSTLPVMCIIKTIGSSLLDLFYYILCLGYLGIRLYVIFTINSMVMQWCICDASSYGSTATGILSLVLTLLNFFHKTTFVAVFKMLNGQARLRMNPRQALHELASDAVLHTENRVRGPAAGSENSPESGDEDIDEASSTVSVSISYDIFTLFRNAFHLPASWARLGSDVGTVCSLVWFSGLIFVLYELFTRCFEMLDFDTLSLSMKTLGLQMPGIGIPLHPLLSALGSRMHAFISSCALTEPLFIMHASILVNTCLCFVLYAITHRVRSRVLITVFHCSRLHLAYSTGIYYTYFMIGMFTHLTFTLLVNNNDPIFCPETPLLSVAVHLVAGIVVNRFTRTFRRNIFFSFRPGLVTSLHPLGYCHHVNTIRLIIESRWTFIFVAAIENLLFTCVVTFTSIYVGSFFCPPPPPPPPIILTDMHSKYISIKFVTLSYVLAGELGDFLAAMCLYIILVFCQMFGAMNYVFNQPIIVPDKSRLLWDANVNTETSTLKNAAKSINRLLRRQNARCEAKEAEAGGDANGGTMSPRITAGPRSSAKTAREHRGMGTKELRFMRKYRITGEKIEKYYGKKHKGKFSLFYYPRHYVLFATLTTLVCIAVLLGFWYFFCALAYYLAILTMPGSGLVYVASLIGATRVISALATERQLCAAVLFKHLILALFTNLIWPILSAAIYMYLYYDSNGPVRVSELFLMFWAFSFVTHQYVTRIIAKNFTEQLTSRFLLQKLISATFFNAMIISSYLMYRKYLGAVFLFKGIFTVCFAYYALQFIGEMASGIWLERIKEKYFLKEIVVEDYVSGRGS